MTSVDDLIRASVDFVDDDTSERADLNTVRTAFDVILADETPPRRMRGRRRQAARALRFVPAALVCVITLVIAVGAVLLIHQKPDSTTPLAPGSSSTTVTTIRRAPDQTLRDRQLRANAKNQHVTASRQILTGFAVFSLANGTRLPGGLVVSHPSVTKLPILVLRLAANASTRSGSSVNLNNVDLRDTREVRAPSGQAMYVIPGPHSLCVIVTHTYFRTSTGASGACDRTVHMALEFGGGDAQAARGRQVNFGIVSKTHPTRTITISHGRTRTITPTDGISYVTS